MPVSDAAADAVAFDPSVAKPLSERLARKLARSAVDSPGFAERCVIQYGGGQSEIVDDTFVVVAGEKNAPLQDAIKMVHETDETLAHDLAHRPTHAERRYRERMAKLGMLPGMTPLPVVASQPSAIEALRRAA